MLTYWTHPQGQGGGGSAGKIFATMLLHSWFPLTWYATWPCSEKVDFWPLNPSPQAVGEGSAGKIFVTMFLHFIIPFNMICNETMFWKSWTLTYWPHPLVSWGRGGVCGHYICYHFVAFCDRFNLICNMTMFWKSWLLTFWPHHPGSRGRLQTKYLLPWCCIVIPFNLMYNMTIFWKSWLCTYWPHPQGRGEGSACKIFATMLLHIMIPFNLICNMTMF